MTCRDNKDLMMAYLDGELDDAQKNTLEAHLKTCPQCQSELDEFNKLKDLTDSISLAEPEDHVWEHYWDNVYNRAERHLGWILSSLGGIVLFIYGGYLATKTIIMNPGVDLIFKVCLVVLIVGCAILFVSVLRERLYFWQKDRYKDVRR